MVEKHPLHPHPMELYRIILQTKPHIKKYLQSVYGDPLVLNLQNDFGDVVISKLVTNLSCNLSNHDIDVRLNRFTEDLPIFLPKHWLFKIPKEAYQINSNKTININRYFENLFEKSLHETVEDALNFLGINRQTSIDVFATTHGIELGKDVTFDALKQMEYRFRMNKAALTGAGAIFKSLLEKSQLN
jgi:hypothetical protein